MKISLAWALSHLRHNQFQNVQQECDSGIFFERFGAAVAEIEHVQKVVYPVQDWYLARVIEVEQDVAAIAIIDELAREIRLPWRQDIRLGGMYLVVEKNSWHFVTLAELYAEKDGLVPVLWVHPDELMGGWRGRISARDYILTFDNKSLSHRPDLWGHRGFAREIGVLYLLDMIPDEQIYANYPVVQGASGSAIKGDMCFTNTATDVCRRIASITVSESEVAGSWLWMAIRLAAIDARPINSIVDLTNYVMYDIGQPMHAFDRDRLVSGSLVMRHALSHEKLTLLDGQELLLRPEDVVIADAQGPVSLAGIMGGAESGISVHSRSFILESAAYQATPIRLSAAYHKLRTQSSMRYEKGLDPAQNTLALTRFIALCAQERYKLICKGPIYSLGNLPIDQKIDVSYRFIIERIGVTVPVERIESILRRLGFGVTHSIVDSQDLFVIDVPSYRAAHRTLADPVVPEDIVEEIARFVGFDQLPSTVPMRPMVAQVNLYTKRLRTLQDMCAYGLRMHEVCNYALYDDAFLQQYDIQVKRTYQVANPVAQTASYLVTSLIPHLFKNITQNNETHDTVAFFEIARVWRSLNGALDQVAEQEEFAGLWYSHAVPINFYEKKEALISICRALGVIVSWRKPEHELESWYHPYMTAELVYNNKVIGYAGMVRPDVVARIAERYKSAQVYAFSLNAGEILRATPELLRCEALPRFQPVSTDLSMFIPKWITVARVEECIAQSDARITHIQLVDYFEKPEWPDQRSITIRYVLSAYEKTFTKEEVDQVRLDVVTNLTTLGAVIR